MSNIIGSLGIAINRFIFSGVLLEQTDRPQDNSIGIPKEHHVYYCIEMKYDLLASVFLPLFI